METKNSSVEKIKNYFGVNNLLKSFLFPLAIALCISFTFMYFFEITVVDGISMEGTLHTEDKLLVSKKSYSNSSPKYKDIVIIKHKTEKCDFIVKRVIGVAGQTVEIKNNELFVDGVKLEEDYINEIPTYSKNMSITIPDGKVFVMGDNRNHSYDSREIGLIDDSDIVGKVIYSLWPFNSLD
ncbi:MAG: signal peptidase I [Clostridium sp.]